MTATAYPYIETDATGVAIIAGTTTKVIEIVLDHLAHHWGAHEIRRQYPSLGLAQIHSAMSVYFNNQAELDREIEIRIEKTERIQTS